MRICRAAALLISAGAREKAVQQVLGHRSVAFTMTVYRDMFDSDLDDLAVRLDSFATRDERGMDSATRAAPGALRAL